MATHTDTDKIIPYVAQSFPNLGNTDRFIANELSNIQKSIASIAAVMRMIEARMNANGLT